MRASNLGDFAAGVGVSVLFGVLDEVSLAGFGTAIAIDRPPMDGRLRWVDADAPPARTDRWNSPTVLGRQT